MAETANIAKMAEKLSDEIFGEFLWTKVGPTNQNWPCEDPSRHKVKTHPSDVVFFYDEPYSVSRTYINCDLKSYAANSISPINVRGAVESLAKQIACAETSDEWRRLYVHENVTSEVAGLLFVYNHDGGYDKDFQAKLETVKSEKLDLPKGTKLVVMGPADIFWLDNVRYEINFLRGKQGDDRLPDREYCKFFYPQLEKKKNIQLQKARAATLEILTSKLIILEYRDQRIQGREGIVVFYRGPGDSSQEFKYLFDLLLHYQVLRQGFRVRIKTLQATSTASSAFQKAKQDYIEGMGMSEEDESYPLVQLIQSIEYSGFTQVVSTNYSDVELGMDYE